MTTISADHPRTPVSERSCGCCGRVLPPRRVTELGNTPGVYICSSCALWAARRAARLPVPRIDPRPLVRWLRGRVRTPPEPVGMAIPILHSADLDRTAAYYQSLGLKATGRYEGYLVLNAGPAEMHFSSDGDVGSPGHAFVHVADARRLWKELKAAGVTGVGPVEDQSHGLREFLATDPDGNRIRIGSPISEA